MTTRYVFLNGRVLPAEDAAISPFDIGILRGYAVFDLLRTVDGRPFLLAEHLDRLRASAAELGLTVPESDERIAEAIDDLLARNGHEEATVRLVLTGGVSPDGMGFDPSTPTFYILTHDLHEPPAELYETGGRLLTEKYTREVPTAKTTNYVTMLRHKPRLAEEGALDLLYHDTGRLFEAASASFYLVRGTTILAPRDQVLAGTVGGYVLGLVADRYDIELVDLSLDDCFSADEAFITSTTRGVVPIVRIDDRVIGDGAVGPVVRDLVSTFRREALGRT